MKAFFEEYGFVALETALSGFVDNFATGVNSNITA